MTNLQVLVLVLGPQALVLALKVSVIDNNTVTTMTMTTTFGYCLTAYFSPITVLQIRPVPIKVYTEVKLLGILGEGLLTS